MCVLCGQMFGEIHWSERQLDPVQVSHGSGETSRRRTEQVWETLTPQELHIAQLAVEGLSNKEIGSILRISERTVKFHVGNILTKLQMNSRRELSAAYTNFIPRVQSGIAT